MLFQAGYIVGVERPHTACMNEYHLVYVIHACTYEHKTYNTHVFVFIITEKPLLKSIHQYAQLNTRHTHISQHLWRDGSRLCAFAEDPGWAPNTHMAAHTLQRHKVLHPYLTDGGSCTHMVHICTFKDTHAHIKSK